MRFVEQQVVPTIRELSGWKGAVGLASPDGRRALMLIFWDSLETLVASAGDMRLFQESAASSGVNVVTGVERFEVILDERPE
jgi:hypothetical protein